MSENSNKTASPSQLEALNKIQKRMYGGTASTAIVLNSDFKFMNAVGKGDKTEATRLLLEAIEKMQTERIAWKTAHPTSEQTEALPATV